VAASVDLLSLGSCAQDQNRSNIY